MYKQVPKEEVLLILLEMMLLSNPGKKYCPLLNLLLANSLNLLQIYILTGFIGDMAGKGH